MGRIAPAAPSAITALEPDPVRPGAVHVWIDGRRFCTVPAEDASAEGLSVGTVLDTELEGRLALAADREAAFRTALRALERRPFASADLTRRLVQKGHPPRAASDAVTRLTALGLLDDARFAAQFIDVQSARGRGPVRLRADLRRVGVESAVIDRALADKFPPGTDLMAQPLALARKRAAQLGNLPRPVKRRRLLAYLARRGFRGREVLDAVDAALEPSDA